MNFEIKNNDLVGIRIKTEYGYSYTWWRVKFIDNDGTFIGELERHHWFEYKSHKKGDHEKLNIIDVNAIYKEGEQFCYSDGITICECEGLCKNK